MPREGVLAKPMRARRPPATSLRERDLMEAMAWAERSCRSMLTATLCITCVPSAPKTLPWEEPCSGLQSAIGASHPGCVVEWTCHAPTSSYHAICDLPGTNPHRGNPDLVLDWVVLRGTGSVHLGAALPLAVEAELARLPTFKDLIGPSCSGTTMSVLLGEAPDIDRAISIVGA